jgi:hypothetical protein
MSFKRNLSVHRNCRRGSCTRITDPQFLLHDLQHYVYLDIFQELVISAGLIGASKGKTVTTLYLIKQHAMKAYGGMDV